MVKKLVGLSFVLILAAAAWGSASSIEVAPTISAVEISGEKLVLEKDIAKVIFSGVGQSLSQDKVKSDLKAIYSLGYFADVNSSFEPFEGGTKIIFMVKENPQIKTIRFEGNTVYPSAELHALIGSKTEALLNFKAMQDDIEKINNKYKKDGYMLARVIDVETGQDRVLHFKIGEGRVESISLNGNEVTQDYVILRELNTKPGSVLNEEILKKDLHRVFNLGFFSEVTPNFEPGSTKDNVVLALKIKESRTSTINFGGGFGEREGWFGFLDLSVNNLFGTAQGVMARAQGGQQLSTYQFKYYNPWFWPEKLGDHAALTARRWLTQGRDIFVSNQDGIYNGFDISLGKPLRENYNITWTLGSENVSPLLPGSFEAYRADTVGLTLSFDTRDFWLNPKEGRYYTLDLKQGWNTTNSTSFSKIGVDLNHYFPVFGGQVLAFHGGVGVGLGTVPIGELYLAGGANSIRGYYPTESRRGKYKILTNAELRLNFSDLFQGVFFYDLGNAWNSGSPDTSQFISGWGPGVRVTTPLGPIRLDYGVASGKSFSEGVMHFSIGQAF